jgi:hypothetical protein
VSERKKHFIPLRDGETEALLSKLGYVELGFGPRGAWLTWEEGTEMPPAVRELGMMRGVLNENCQGAGI